MRSLVAQRMILEQLIVGMLEQRSLEKLLMMMLESLLKWMLVLYYHLLLGLLMLLMQKEGVRMGLLVGWLRLRMTPEQLGYQLIVGMLEQESLEKLLMRLWESWILMGLLKTVQSEVPGWQQDSYLGTEGSRGPLRSTRSLGLPLWNKHNLQDSLGSVGVICSKGWENFIKLSNSYVYVPTTSGSLSEESMGSTTTQGSQPLQ